MRPHTCFANVGLINRLQRNSLIYNYKIEDEDGCGEIKNKQERIQKTLRPLIEEVIQSL